MRIPCSSVVALVLALCAVVLLSNPNPGAQAQTSTAATTVPRLVRFAGTARDLNGSPVTGVVGIMFSLYAEETGGAPLWLETQNAQADASGHYSVLLGTTKADGLPAELFTSEQARWVGVQISGQAEQPRVLLVSAPYALKAGDAETVGGLPASAFVLANSAGAGVSKGGATAAASTATTKAASSAVPANPAVTGKGVVNFIPMWDTTSDIIDSIMFQKSAQIGINTTAPAATLDVSGKTDVRDTLTLFPKSTDATLLVSGTSFKVDSTGKVTFISGQTFPGTGTITGITTASGSGLSGGGTSGTLSLKVPAAGVTNAMLQNSKVTLNASTAGGLTVPGAMTLGSTYTIGLKACSANQVLQYSGTTWACKTLGTGTGTVTSVGSGAGLTGGPITTSGTLSIASAGVTNTMLQHSSLTLTPGTGLTGAGAMSLGNSYSLNIDTTKIPLLSSANTFTASQSFTGNPGITVSNSTADGIDISAGSGMGIYGVSASNTGVDGYSNGFDGGVFEASSTGAYGSRSDSYADSSYATGAAGWEFGGTQKTIGVWGYAGSGIGVGSYNEAYSSSSQGTVCCAGFYPIGLWADTAGDTATTNPGIGALTTVDNGWSLVSYSNSAYSTVYLENEESADANSLVLETVGGNFGGVCTVDVSGNLYCSGSKSAVVPVDGGSKKVALYAIEAPENWFEDAGSGQLSNGSAVIQLENTFGQAVNTGIDYHVFLTPNGDCKGLYVSQKSATSFEVHELGGGTTSGVAFDYRIMAKRKGFESIRMADKTKEFTTHRPSKRPAGARTPSPDEFRKEQLRKAQEMSKKKVFTTAAVVKK
jgi:hypothetical protein